MSTVKNLLNRICLCLSLLSRVDGFSLGQQSGERIHRQAYDLDNNCTSFDDSTLCNTAVELTNRIQATETSENGCLLPPHPVFGKWSTLDQKSFSPGMEVPTGTVLQIYCNTGYKLDGSSLLACIGGKWSSDMGQCLRTCPPKYSTTETKIICVNNGTETENCTNPTDGTIAKYECAPFHENINSQNELNECFYGAWSHPHFECTPVCGKKSSVDAQMLIINGTTAKQGAYPWQVLLYSGKHNKRNKQYVCGGSLISQRIILTAAHCITYSSDGKKKDKNSYIVAVGKHYVKYDDARDKYSAQFSSLDDMFIPQTYRGSSLNFGSDIAVLVTTKKFMISQRVQPICIDWTSRYDSSKNLFGHVAGLGYTTETGPDPVEELQELDVPLINDAACFDNLPQDFTKYLTTDKMCAGYLNQSISVCVGDTGSGLFVNQKDRYYIIGIASLIIPRRPNRGCDIQNYALYTKVSTYVEPFIVEKVEQYQNERNQTVDNKDEKCIVPQHLQNSRLSVLGSKLPPNIGDTIPSGTTIQLTCEEFYVLQGSSNVTCNNGQWKSPFGSCLAPCPSLTSSRSTEVSCNGIDCTNPTHGTIATFKCAPFYENFDLNVNPFRTCQNGQWKPVGIPRCVPVCGVKPEFNTQQKNSLHPWNVAIFKQDGGKKRFVCAGTLVNERIIVTSAQCICDEDGKRLPQTLFEVVVGRSTEDYEDTRDVETQFSELEELFVPDEYKGKIRKYWADIAVIITKRPFNMTKRVQLLCLDWKNTLAKEFEYPKIQGNIAAPYESQVLEIEIPFVDNTQCYKQLSENLEFDSSYYTVDKLCSGYINLNTTSSCNLNLGTGLTSKNRHDNRYYLTGIASVFPSKRLKNCDNKTWILFTQISRYISSFIFEKNKLYTPIDTPYFQTSCGVKSLQVQTLIVEGNNVTKGDYPWQVAIYRGNTKKVLICGGTLINQRIILTAAHCVTDKQGERRPKEIFTVAVGKYYRDFDHAEDEKAQFSKLIDIFISNQYQGELQNYVGDVAILVTEKSFVLSRQVMPVCVDWENKYEGQFLRPNATGYVSGWGFTKENTNPSQILKDLEVPYIEKNQCKSDIPNDYEVYLTFDKMCSGHLNKSKGVCRGDSGGGLVFKNIIDGRYYITGIVSLSPQAPTGGCDSQQYALYTRVSHYVKDFITKKAQIFWR